MLNYEAENETCKSSAQHSSQSAFFTCDSSFNIQDFCLTHASILSRAFWTFSTELG